MYWEGKLKLKYYSRIYMCKLSTTPSPLFGILLKKRVLRDKKRKGKITFQNSIVIQHWCAKIAFLFAFLFSLLKLKGENGGG